MLSIWKTKVYVVRLRCSPQYKLQRLSSIFISLKKTIFPYYFINISYSSLAFDQL